MEKEMDLEYCAGKTYRSTLVSLLKTKFVALENFGMKMETHTQGIGRTFKPRDWDTLKRRKKRVMKGTGRMISRAALELKIGREEVIT